MTGKKFANLWLASLWILFSGGALRRMGSRTWHGKVTCFCFPLCVGAVFPPQLSKLCIFFFSWCEATLPRHYHKVMQWLCILVLHGTSNALGFGILREFWHFRKLAQLFVVFISGSSEPEELWELEIFVSYLNWINDVIRRLYSSMLTF